jgi:hypothetical protein
MGLYRADAGDCGGSTRDCVACSERATSLEDVVAKTWVAKRVAN